MGSVRTPIWAFGQSILGEEALGLGSLGNLPKLVYSEGFNALFYYTGIQGRENIMQRRKTCSLDSASAKDFVFP